MKKCIVLLFAICAVLCCGFDFQEADEGFVILPHANREGSHANDAVMAVSYGRISLLGACNPYFPLYVNGEEVPVTGSGFFCVFTELELGDNLFLFENGDAVVGLTVTRFVREPVVPAETVFFEPPLYGVTIQHNASRFYDGDDDNKHGVPLPAGVLVYITGEVGDCYIIQDGSYVFKSSVELIEDYDYDNPVQAFIPLQDAVITLNPPPALLSQALVILDAGHGGSDPGALGPPGEFGWMEKDFNLYVTQVAADYLQSRGVNVIFLRDTDESFFVRDRIDYIAQLPTPADLVVSVHGNSMPMHHDFTSEQGPLMFFTLDHSEKAANFILEYICEKTGHEFVPAIRRNFAMARYTHAPSMLFEMGFLCNPADYERMLDFDYLDLIGIALGEGIAEYLLIYSQDDKDNDEDEHEHEQEAVFQTEQTQTVTQESEPEEPVSRIYTVVIVGMVLLIIAAFIFNIAGQF
jgi:N-acetylmuramoyl-L-alanine amidase